MATNADVAKIVLREIPLTQLNSFLKLKGGTAIGQGCGLGCSQATGMGCIDRLGHSGLTQADLTKALKDKAGLKNALEAEIKAHHL